MEEEVLIEINQGDSKVFTNTISGLASLEGFTSKMYISKTNGAEIDIITGSILGLVITFTILNEYSKHYPVGVHRYEMKIWDANDKVYTAPKGDFIVYPVLKSDPS